MDKVCEGAAGFTILSEVEQARVLGSVGNPLGSESQVVVHSLVTEVEMLISPVGSRQLRGSLDLTDFLLRTSELLRLVHCENIVKNRARWDGLKISQEVRVACRHGAWELKFASWLESELPWEDVFAGSFTSLVLAGHLRETNGLNPLGLGGEAGFKRLERDRLGVWDVVREIVGEPVQVILTINAEHGNEVGGVNAISEELDTHAWGKVGRLSVDRLGDGHADKSSVGTLEHTCVRVATLADPLDLGSCTLSVDCLVAATVPGACELVTSSVKDGGLVDDKSASQVPSTGLSVLSHFAPDFIGLILAGKCEVIGLVKILSILCCDKRGK